MRAVLTGTRPANYFDPPEVSKEDSDAFDAKVSWSQTAIPTLVAAAKSSPSNAAPAATAPINTAAAVLPAASSEPDAFGLDAWAKEMEALLLSTPTGGSKKTDRAKAADNKPVQKPVEKAVEKPIDKVPEKEAVATAWLAAPVAAVVAPSPPAAAEAVVDNSEWIVWMQRALTAEQNINDLIKAADSDRLEFEKKLEESNQRAMRFEEQVMQMIDTVHREKQQMEARFKQDLAEAQSKAAASGSSESKGRLDELERKLAAAVAEKDELMNSVEADVQQFTQLLEEERMKHCQSVEQATEYGVKLEVALERIVELETALQERVEELEDARKEREKQAAMEKTQREELEKKLSEKAAAESSSATWDKQRVAELENELLIEKHLKDALLLENQFLKSQADKAKQQRPVSVRSDPVVVQAPPTVPREPEISLQTKKPVASTSEASQSVSQVSAEMMRQRLLRAKPEDGKGSKVTAVVSRMSQDLGKSSQRSATASSPSHSSSTATTTATAATAQPAASDSTSPAPVSRSRANEILLRAKALAEKAKKDTQGAEAK